jgi:hypothetical protein
VNPVSANLLQGTLSVLPDLPGTAFPRSCCGGFASLTVTTTFTAGDNNIFNVLPTGGFTLTTTCSLDLGVRAPVVISASPATGDCASCQNLLISGACFILPNGALNVTSAFAVDQQTGAIIQAQHVAVLSNVLVDALFCFGSANAGHTFLIFVSGPNGTSRNLTTDPVAGCPTGNEQGVTVTFTCAKAPSTGGGGGGPTPCPTPAVTNCDVTRNGAGIFILTITGTNFAANATVTVAGVTPKKIISQTSTSIVAKGKVCANLPGNIIVTNPPGCNANPNDVAHSSAPFSCTKTCVK